MQAFDIQDDFGYLIGRTSLLLKRLLNQGLQRQGFRLTADQFFMLVLIGDNEGITQGQIGELCSKDKTNVSRMLALMEENDLVVRERSQSDGRSHSVSLTTEGHSQKKKVMEFVLRGQKHLLNGFDRADIQRLKDFLDRIDVNIHAMLNN